VLSECPISKQRICVSFPYSPSQSGNGGARFDGCMGEHHYVSLLKSRSTDKVQETKFTVLKMTKRYHCFEVVCRYNPLPTRLLQLGVPQLKRETWLAVNWGLHMPRRPHKALVWLSTAGRPSGKGLHALLWHFCSNHYASPAFL